MVLLAKKDIELVINQLNDEQVSFLTNRMKIKKKSRWLQLLANFKGIDIDEKMSDQDIEERLEDWILVDVKDGGYQKRPYKCDCGQTLRFQYVIRKKAEGAIRYLGENCFENYLSLPSSVIKDVKKGMYAIDLERDEILVKFKKNLFFPLHAYMHLSLPQDLIDQYEVGLPLSDNQIALVERINQTYEEEKKLSALFERLSIEQQQFVMKMTKEDRRELLLLVEDGVIESFFQPEDLSECDEFINKQILLNLPLLEKQKQKVKEWQLAKRRTELLHSLTSEQQEFILSYSKEEQAILLDRVQKPLHYSVEDIEDLPVDDQIKRQVMLKLPLLKEQIYQIQKAQNLCGGLTPSTLKL